MTLKAIIASDLDYVFLNANELGETISYTPSGGSASSIVAVVSGREIMETDNGHGLEQDCHASLLIQATDVSQPALGDTATFDGFTWGVVGWHEIMSSQAWRVRVYRRNVVERSANSHRIPRG